MKLSAAQEAAQWEEEEQATPEGTSDSSWGQWAEMEKYLKELNARQSRIENHLIKLIPSARKAEEQFATIVLAGKELREEMEEHKKGITISLSGYTTQVTTTAGQIKGEFQHQLRILQEFFDATLKISDKNEQMVGQCQDMVATSSAIYHKGSAGVQEVSEKTQVHLKAVAEAHCKEIEGEAQNFQMIYRRLSKLIFIGTIAILLSAFAAGTMAGAMWSYMKQHQVEEMRR
jgi:hypothetical protein